MKRNMWSLGVVDLLVGACCALLAFIQGSIDGNWADEHAITGSWDGGWQIACFLVAVLLALLGVVALAAAHDMGGAAHSGESPFVGHRAARGSAVRLIVWLSPLCALGIAVSGGLDFMIRMRWFAAHRMSGVNGIPLYSALLAIAVIGLLLSLYQLRTLHDAAAHRTEG